jgi:hypothetical protein
MIKHRHVYLANCLIMTLLLGCILNSSTVLAKSSKGRWKVLFNGKDIGAWRGYQRDSFPSKEWVIDNGALKTVVGSQCDLITKEKYKNFELALEWKVTPRGNSGIMYNVTEDVGKYPWLSGPEMQILDDNEHPDGKNPKTTAGALYALIAPTNKVLLPVGQFNKASLIVNNNHVEHWLNGKKIVEYELGSDTLNKLIAESKFKEMPRFAKEREGHIVLQHHGEEVWYRNIRIRVLP